jgi:hypothetical protein
MCLPLTSDGMTSKGVRAIFYQGTKNAEADKVVLLTSNTLIGYTVCYAQVVFVHEYQTQFS